jgi:excisionase family DNA binding protein
LTTAVEPYTMPIKNAAPYFGYHPGSLYAMVASGKLIYGQHYLKVGKKVLIKTKAFKEYMHEKCGVAYGGD